MKEFNVGNDVLFDYLNSLGADLKDSNPIQFVSTDYIPALIKHFGLPENAKTADPTINFPVTGSNYHSSSFGKKILLLDGFYNSCSSDMLETHVEAISRHQFSSDGTDIRLYSIIRVVSELFGMTPDIEYFLKNVSYYSCNSSRGTITNLTWSKEERIFSVISAIKPDVVFVISGKVALFLDIIGSGIDYGLISAKRFKGKDWELDFLYPKDPIWLKPQDLGLFFDVSETICDRIVDENLTKENPSYSVSSDIFNLPDDLFTRKDLTSKPFINNPLPAEVKKDINKFKEFIEYVSSLSGCKYERADVETLLRILTGYPFENDRDELIWDSRNGRDLFYVIKYLFKGKHNKYDVVFENTTFVNGKIAFDKGGDISKEFTPQNIDIDVVNKLNNFYPNLYKPKH